MMASSNMVYVTVMVLWAVCCAATSHWPNVSLSLSRLTPETHIFVQAYTQSQLNQQQTHTHTHTAVSS